ncbi:MAG: BON domain-containing protein [Desulfovermiculus sp.]|nr:BON domain-containing protein [Desulfovermiculus sp.]
MDQDSHRQDPSFQEEMEHLSDEEAEEAIWDRIVDQAEVDMENLHLQCQNGVVSVEGLLPSALQYHELMRVLRDELNLEHVVDRIRIQDEVNLGDDEDLDLYIPDEE